MRILTVLGTAVVLTAVTASSVNASPVKPVCNLFTDRVGDGRHLLLTPLASPALDIVGGDVASGEHTVVGVLRLVSTDLEGDPLALLGMRWILAFEIAGTHYAFSTRVNVLGNYEHELIGGDGSWPGVTIDSQSIRWTAPRSAFGALTDGAVFSRFSAVTTLFGGNADSAVGGETTYADRTPSCVNPL